ncbi:Na+/H+ antiporter subunit G [Corynebacterium sp. 320]|uniref:Na+/H+ antiporter subunit G n=1 Tax=Corynebacterium zhongnanshanii TaxID=2768834 RepID=A0ABQ6VHJ8_9CORY|nr:MULTISPECIES: Na+/H+ antiporter subunit G [Corynebacterium]KAB1502864.1 Na+/H+ antiporter subunit G [Corynebacterium sp. 320]KAB1552375.1 Na+/H+ antiporter subunit G [Corynebacterium sp. 321]KAB1554410.1 Na+/H+ antiporter subunit G [Corynebacterium sp. 319]KAB3522621.1 Na+/H+ antiporter subunit G [Corynebacterium zhongnanshanii]KAB3526527.1 Na+/H+ antiporter subunit G [Corynebacterium sp. 250]
MTFLLGTDAGQQLYTFAAEAGELQEFREPNWFAAILAGVLAIIGAVFIFVSARAMYLAPDALSQVNMVGPAVGVGIPLLICANLVHTFAVEGFVVGALIRAIVAIVALLVVGAVGSYVMGRALHATHWDHTVPLSGGQRASEPK